jgi:hypothetical protein
MENFDYNDNDKIIHILIEFILRSIYEIFRIIYSFIKYIYDSIIRFIIDKLRISPDTLKYILNITNNSLFIICFNLIIIMIIFICIFFVIFISIFIYQFFTKINKKPYKKLGKIFKRSFYILCITYICISLIISFIYIGK